MNELKQQNEIFNEILIFLHTECGLAWLNEIGLVNTCKKCEFSTTCYKHIFYNKLLDKFELLK